MLTWGGIAKAALETRCRHISCRWRHSPDHKQAIGMETYSGKR